MTALSRRRFLAISAAATAVGPAARASAPVRWQGYALGARISLTLHAPGPLARTAITNIRALLAHVERLFSLYDPASALSRLNASGNLPSPHPDLLRLLDTAGAVHRATDGHFDPTVQPLWTALARGADPATARRCIGWNRVRYSRSAITLAPDQALTFNGIAQGHATDLARASLESLGLTRVLINIGEFAALGGPFRLGISDPVAGLVATRRLINRAIATSSPSVLHLANGSPHILNPQGTGGPLWSTVSVEADNAAVADAASTAFCLMKPTHIQSALARLPGAPSATLVNHSGTITRLRATA